MLNCNFHGFSSWKPSGPLHQVLDSLALLFEAFLNWKIISFFSQATISCGSCETLLAKYLHKVWAPKNCLVLCNGEARIYIYIYMYNICIYIYNISILSHVPDQEALPLQTWLQNIFKKWRLVQVARMDLDLARTFCWCPMQHLSLQIRANQHLLEGEQP